MEIQENKTLLEQGIELPFPTLEDFRKIYEEEWTQKYKEMDNGL